MTDTAAAHSSEQPMLGTWTRHLTPERAAERRTAPLVGIGGLMRHGKDAFADFLVDDHEFKKTFMSESLTQALSLIGPRGPWVALDHDIAWEGGYGICRKRRGDFMRYAELVAAVGYAAAKEHQDAREYLQGLGTEVGRNILGEDTWVRAAAAKLQKFRAAGSPAVITGIRYQNELDMIHELGGIAVWVERPQVTESSSTAAHSSETSLSSEDFDLVISNNGTLAELQRLAARFVAELEAKQPAVLF